MGEARRRSVNTNGLLVPDRTLVGLDGGPLLSPGQAASAAQPKHYGVVLLENGQVVRQTAVNDPFVKVAVRVAGWKKAWQVLRGRYVVEIQVHGDAEAVRTVFGLHVMIQR